MSELEGCSEVVNTETAPFPIPEERLKPINKVFPSFYKLTREEQEIIIREQIRLNDEGGK